jgi:hypothetical protein
MLTLPALDGFAEIAVFGDDELPHVFYAVPPRPRIRRGEDGIPILIFLKYRSLPLGKTEADGGGLLQFQTELTLTEGESAAVRSELQHRIQAGGQQGDVELRSPIFIDGDAQLVTFQPSSGGMIEAIEGSTHPSLHDILTASFNLGLSRDGAVLLWDQLRADPSPIAVRYRLSILARMPAGRMHIFLRAGALRDGWAAIAARPIGPDRQSAMASGGIAGVDVLDWPSSGSSADTLKARLQEWGWHMLDAAAGGIIAGGAPPGATPADGPEVVADVDIVVDGRSAIVWTLSPQGNIGGLVRPEDAANFLEVDLTDPIFRHVRVETRCNADFERDGIAAVTVTLSYGAQRHDATFTQAGGVDAWEVIADPSLGQTYRYRSMVHFRNSSRTMELPEASSDLRNLLVSIDNAGWVRVEVTTTADWSRITQVQVHLAYEDADRGVPREETTLVLTRAARSQHYERAIYAVADRPFGYAVTYLLASGATVARAQEKYRGGLLIIPDVFDRSMAVRLVAPAGFEAVASHVVELRYDDVAGRVEAETVAMTAERPTATWVVPLQSGMTEAYTYRATTTFRDGHSQQGGWNAGVGSSTVAIGEVPASLLRVLVVPDLVDFAAVKLVVAKLRHDPPAPAPSVQKQLVFQAGHTGSQEWVVPLASGDTPDYTLELSYILADGSKRDRPGQTSTEPTVIVPALPG